VTEPTRLYVSNDPARFTGHGVLFSAELPASGSACRLQYDHTSAGSARTRLLAAIANTGSSRRTVTLIGASAGPRNDAAAAASAVDTRFASALRATAVSRHVLEPGRSFVLCDLVLSTGECAAGRYDVESDGAGLEFRVVSCDPSHHQLGIHTHLPDVPPDGTGRRGIFSLEE
jgi:hypothetical protein